MSNIGTLIDFAQQRVKTDRATVGLPGIESTNLIYVADQADREFNDAFLIGGEGRPRVRGETGGTIPSTTNVNDSGDVAIGDTSITVDSIANATSGGGAGLIRDQNMIDIFEYTNGSSTTITGVTGVSFPHEDDDEVQWLPALPSNFDSPRSSIESEDGMLVDDLPYRYTDGDPKAFEYSIYESSTGKYVIFPDGAAGDWILPYNKIGDTIDEESDSHTLPVKYEMFIVWRLVEHIYMTFDEEKFATQALLARRDADKILRRALKTRMIGRAVKIPRRRLPTPYSDPSLYRQDA